MSELRVDKIVSSSGSGAVEFTQGISVPAGQTISGIAQTAEGLTSTASINTSGIITATRFSGDGSTLTGVASTENVRTNSLVVSGVSTFQSNVTISGNLTVDGTTTSIDTVNLVIEDKNIGIGTTTAASNTTADGGGFTLFGGACGDKTLTWVNSTTAWTSNQDFNLISGKVYEINGSTVLSSSQVLGKSVPSGTIVGDTDSQTLSSKTLCSATLTGTLTANGGAGSNGQFLQSTGSGVQWAAAGGAQVMCISGSSTIFSCNAGSCGFGNFFVGCNAGSRGYPTNSIAIGDQAGRYAGTANSDYNVFFGYQTGQYKIGGHHNFFAGACAGRSGFGDVCNTTGSHNTLIGFFAGACLTTGSNNFFAGLCAGFSNKTASNNIFLGCNSGCSITGGCNVVIGSFTGTGFTACNNHIFLSDGAGNNRLQLNNCGALGLAGANYGTAGQVLTSCGSGATPVWAAAGGGGSSAIAGCCTSNFLSCNTCAPNITSGANNFLVGCNAGRCNTSANNNTFIGFYAGRSSTTACHNFVAGFCAGASITTGIRNNVFGGYAGACLTGGQNNNFFGYQAGCNNLGGTDNNFLGYQAGTSNTSGGNNIAMGCFAGLFNTSGSNNVFMGLCSGWCSTTVCNNIFIGCQSGCSITGGCNVVIGSFTGTGFTACTNHIFLSDGAGNNRLQLNNCGALGLAGANYGTAGQVLTSCGSGATPVWAAAGGGGSSAIAGCCTSNFLSCNTCAPNISSGTSGNNFLLGCNAGLCITNGNHNTFLGNCAGCGSNTGQYNIFMGNSAGKCNGTGNHNMYLGAFSGQKVGDAVGNIMLGGFTGQCMETGSYLNTFIGHCAGAYHTTGKYNTYLGWNAGAGSYAYCAGTGNYNVFLGSKAGRCNRSGARNFFGGGNAGGLNSTGCNNVFIGEYAGYCNVTGCNNIAIGCAAGYDGLYNFGTTGGSNIIVIGNNAHTASYVKVAWTTGSDARDKTNIIPIPVGKDFLKQLDPVQYQWADRETGEVTVEKPNYGFLAQDILALENPPLVLVDDHDPEHLKLRESMIVPVLVKTVQELIEEVDALKEEVRILKGE